MLKEALRVYDIGSQRDTWPPHILSSLEHIFGFQDIQWPSDKMRENLLRAKVSNAVRKHLKKYGYVIFESVK
jgi:hypothetical protein